MCGILFLCGKDVEADSKRNGIDLALSQSDIEELKKLNRHRGPDHQKEKLVKLEEGFKAWFCGNVLHLRGQLTPQPIESNDIGNNGEDSDNHEDLLCWNGEIFGGINVANDENDGLVLFELLKKAKNDSEILRTFAQIRGEFAMFYYRARPKQLWFARDYLGRRSLLWHFPVHSEDLFALSSVGIAPVKAMEKEGREEEEEGMNNDLTVNGISHNDNNGPLEEHFPWKEVPANGIYILDLASFPHKIENPFRDCLQLYPWGETEELKPPFGRMNPALPTEEELNIPMKEENIRLLIQHLEDSIRTRVENLPVQDPSEKDFSRLGILFSGGIDSMMMAALADRHIPKEEPIDLINVAFANLEKSNNESPSSKKGPRSKEPQSQSQSSFDEDIQRAGAQGQSQKQKGKEKQKQKIEKPQTKSSSPYDVPDRMTGKAGLQELRALSPEREWRFIEVDIQSEEVTKIESRVKRLIYPSITVLDLSIATALWFASRGIGNVIDPENTELKYPYQSKAKVLLIGIGADEQLGGYSRHRSSYEKGGLNTLIKEMQFDLDRISHRNLGRDDRCISDHGHEARFPFLDERLVSFLSQLPICEKLDMRRPRGEGEKLLLRLAGRSLGLGSSAYLPKRAIQFGSRIAKLKDSKEKGHHTID